MYQNKLLKYLTNVDTEIRRLLSQEKQKCPYIPECNTYREEGAVIIIICNQPLSYRVRERECDTYSKYTLQEIEEKTGVPKKILPFLIMTILSFDDILCSFQNDCNQYDKDLAICNEKSSLIKLMKSCDEYEIRMTREILKSLKTLGYLKSGF